MREAMSTESVKSPANSKEGTVANCDGMPETMEPKAIFAENEPPSGVAKDSTSNLGQKGN